MSQKLRSIPSFASDPRTRERSGRQALRLLSCLSLAGAAACGQVIDSVENGEVACPGAGGDSRDGVVRTKDGDQAFKYETIDGQAVYQGDILIKAGGQSTPNRPQPASKDRFKRIGRCVSPRFCRVRAAMGKEKGRLKSLSSGIDHESSLINGLSPSSACCAEHP